MYLTFLESTITWPMILLNFPLNTYNLAFTGSGLISSRNGFEQASSGHLKHFTMWVCSLKQCSHILCPHGSSNGFDGAHWHKLHFPNLLKLTHAFTLWMSFYYSSDSVLLHPWLFIRKISQYLSYLSISSFWL